MRRLLAVIAFTVALAACYEQGKAPRGGAGGGPPAPPWKAAAIAHGGASNPAKNSDGPRRAVDAALAALARGADPVDAAVAGVVVLEDDPRFNAGTGSRVRIDGETVQMDASLMTSEGRFAAIGVIERVKNPIVVTRAVLDTPHLFLAGDGATRFARTLGLPDYDPATEEMKAKTREIQAKLRAKDPTLPETWKDFDWRRHWNFDKTLREAGLDAGTDTVGVAVRSTDGRFAVALSTGGTSITLRGRVGDVPVYGAGLWAGRSGAIAATGDGERIIEAGLAREAHRWIEEGATSEQVAARAVETIRPKGSIGLIVIGATDMSAAADKEMAWAAREAGSDAWMGPQPGAP